MSVARMQKIRRLPMFKKSVKSIYIELGGNRPNKHESKDTLVLHIPKNQRFLGKDVVSRNFQSQTNEVLLKILCHNVCCLIQEYYENNIESYYSTEKPKNMEIIRIG